MSVSPACVFFPSRLPPFHLPQPVAHSRPIHDAISDYTVHRAATIVTLPTHHRIIIHHGLYPRLLRRPPRP